MDAKAAEHHEFESEVRQLWESLAECQTFMRTAYPTLWDAHWYGKLTLMFEQLCFNYGEDKVARILGQQALDDFKEAHEQILAGMYMACHRPEPSGLDDEDIPSC